MLLSAQTTTRTSTRLAAQRAQTAIKRTMAHMKPEVKGKPVKRARSYCPSSEKGSSNEDADCLDTKLESPQEDGTNVAESDQATKRARVTAGRNANQAVQGPVRRSEPVGKLQVCANGRGSLCEALPYFRAYKKSLHSADVVAKGFLIDQEVEYEDVFGAQVIISSVGGGRIKDPKRKPGVMIRAKDAADNAVNVRSVQNAYQNGSLVAVIAAGPASTIFASSITSFQMALLLSPTALLILALSFTSALPLWVRYPLSGLWCLTMPGSNGTELTLRRSFVCPDCGCCNRRVCWNRWECENKDCQYRRDAPMLPYPQDTLDQENAKFDTAMEKRRKYWGVNGNALNEHLFHHGPFATILQRGYLRFLQTLTLGGYQVRQYFLPDAQGRILGSFSISASPEIHAEPGGSDELFGTSEVTDIDLRRNPAAVVGHKLEGYTRHFQQNFGARYKFGVSVQSKGFAEAPDVILRALQRLAWAKKVAVSRSNAFIKGLPGSFIGDHALVGESGDFNELLALGYMEDDKINAHYLLQHFDSR
ncbi:hypothetical protein MMYC01_210501 [Madurella mycetomatis]|uniref:Uncharacterized protein n=1 Tax=Madurella mycetomatis TaxID=100816 RepID=A0A175VNM1_9PEZI|nr:hypothetical protein MMYC01_210501 [Madurella mycetomatis]